MKPVRIGIIGLGNVGRTYVAGSDITELVAEVLREHAGEHKIAGYTDPARLMDDANVEAVRREGHGLSDARERRLLSHFAAKAVAA